MLVKEITAPNKLQPPRISQSDPEQPGTRQNNMEQLRPTQTQLSTGGTISYFAVQCGKISARGQLTG